MSANKRYRVVILGLLLLILALLAGRKLREPEPVRFQSPPPKGLTGVVPAALQAETQEVPAQAESDLEASSVEPVAYGGEDAEPESKEEAAADSTEAEETEAEAKEFDSREARDEALAEVRQFDEELAATLWTFNPNARKARLKAAELADRAENIEQWVKTQDSRVDWSGDEQKKWQAQRDIWLGHARELKDVSQRLVGTHGTRRKVRNIAREMKDRLESDG